MLQHDRLDIDTHLLMNLASSLHELTAHPLLLEQIPAFLASALHLQPITLAVVRQERGQERQFVTLASYRTPPADENAAASESPTQDTQLLQRNILNFVSPPSPPSPTSTDENASAIPSHLDNQLVFSHRLGEHHLMLLLFPPLTTQPNTVSLEMLHLLAHHLAQSLTLLLRWQESPDPLGRPFDSLTQREWMVLCGLNSEDGEKQLADRMGLSPHTLHSHIKAIYRKLNVQGRLPLLQKFNRALRDYRLQHLTAPSPTHLAPHRVAG